MAALKENTSYEKLSGMIPSVTKAAYKVGEALPKKAKAVDVSQFSGIPQAVKGAASTSSDYQYGSGLSLGNVSVPYGGSTKFEAFHPGIDIANKIGTGIKAFTPGTVEEVVTGYKQGDKGYGNYIIIKDAEGNKHRYSHLHQALVKVGDQVTPQTQIGLMGNTGSTYSTSGGTGSHLDYRIVDAYGKYVNPGKYVK